MPLAPAFRETKSTVGAFREAVQDFLVPELKSIKVPIDALRDELRLRTESLQTEMKLRDDALRADMKQRDDALRTENAVAGSEA